MIYYLQGAIYIQVILQYTICISLNDDRLTTYRITAYVSEKEKQNLYFFYLVSVLPSIYLSKMARKNHQDMILQNVDSEKN